MKPNTIIVQESRELSATEQRTLEACEEDIAKGVKLQVQALQKIRDGRLYRAEFDTFDDYLKERVGKSRQWVSNQINYLHVITAVTESLSTIVDKPEALITETAAREIKNLPPEKQAEVVKKATNNGKKTATAKELKTAKEEIGEFFDGKKPEPEKKPQPKDELATQRSKTVKTAEALLRAFDDLQSLKKNPNHGDAIDTCKELLEVARDWK